jgi:hypothetical protein
LSGHTRNAQLFVSFLITLITFIDSVVRKISPCYVGMDERACLLIVCIFQSPTTISFVVMNEMERETDGAYDLTGVSAKFCLFFLLTTQGQALLALGLALTRP